MRGEAQEAGWAGGVGRAGRRSSPAEQRQCKRARAEAARRQLRTLGRRVSCTAAVAASSASPRRRAAEMQGSLRRGPVAAAAASAAAVWLAATPGPWRTFSRSRHPPPCCQAVTAAPGGRRRPEGCGPQRCGTLRPCRSLHRLPQGPWSSREAAGAGGCCLGCKQPCERREQGSLLLHCWMCSRRCEDWQGDSDGAQLMRSQSGGQRQRQRAERLLMSGPPPGILSVCGTYASARLTDSKPATRACRLARRGRLPGAELLRGPPQPLPQRPRLCG